METITSPHNPVVKLIRSLDAKRQRRETGLFAAEGAEVLARARREGWSPEYLVSERAIEPWGQARRLTVSRPILESLSGQRNAPDVIGVFRQRFTASPAEDDLWLGLETMRDPGNLGTIIRTADAVSAAGLMLIGACCDPYSREAVRASMGSIFSVPLVKLTLDKFLGVARTWPGEIVGTHATSPEDYRRGYALPVLLLIGSESTGLSESLLQACHARVKIPMTGGTESLNAAVAAALMLYEIKRPSLR